LTKALEDDDKPLARRCHLHLMEKAQEDDKEPFVCHWGLVEPINKDTRRHQQAKGLLLFSMTIKKMKRQGALSLSLSSTPYGKNIKR